MPIELNIDLSRVDKAKIRRDKNNKPWLDVVVIAKSTQYGDYMVVVKQTKEERDKRINGVICGNGKNFGKDTSVPGDGSMKRDETDVPWG